MRFSKPTSSTTWMIDQRIQANQPFIWRLPKSNTAALRPIVAEIGAQELLTKGSIAKVSVVGIGMRSHSGVAARLFEALSKGGINILMISTSEIKTSVIIDEAHLAQAANLAHEAFGLSQA